MKRNATAVWNGSGKEGAGVLSSQSGVLNNNQYSFELLRFCSVINYSVIGAANKLLKYFEKNYNPNYLISYADRRWSQGKIYEKLNLLINDKELIDAYAEKSWQYGKKSFDIKDIQELLLESMEK